MSFKTHNAEQKCQTKKVHTALFRLNEIQNEVQNIYDVRCQNDGYLWGEVWSGTGNGGAW